MHHMKFKKENFYDFDNWDLTNSDSVSSYPRNEYNTL